MTIILIIALFIGGGTSFAAESALPGDILYPIKVSVNEEVRSFTAISNKAQSQWDARRAERRLEEAETLAVEGRFNAKTRADIESRFESHAEAFQKHAEKIETIQNARTSFEIHSNFEASLEAHEQVLVRIATEKANVREEVKSLLIEVRTRLNTTVKARSNLQAKVSAEVNGEVKTAAEGKLRAAENKISEVRSFIGRMKTSVSASADVQAEAKLKVAESVVVRGKTEMEAQTYGKAFVSFQEAIRIAQEAKLLVATEERIDIEIKVPGVDVRSESKQETSPRPSAEVESKTKVESESGSTELEEEGKVGIDIGL